MIENKNYYKKIVLIGMPVLIIAVIVELILLIKPNIELKGKEVTPNCEEDIMLGDAGIFFDSDNVSYDNSVSGLTSSTVQDAIDELYDAANTCVTNLSTCQSNLTTAQNNMVTYRDEICPGCVYRYSTTIKYNSNASNANGTNNKLSSSEYTTDYTTLNSNYFLGHVIDSNGYILSSYACGINNGTFFCLRGVDSDQSSLTYQPFYQEGVNVLNKAFPGCNANTSGSNANCSGGVYAYVDSSGYGDVGVYDGAGGCGCTVYEFGYSSCYVHVSGDGGSCPVGG